MTGKARRTAVHLLVAATIILVMANGAVHHTRLDLTESRLHTVSSVTRDLVAGLENEVTITYYRSQRLVERFPQPREINDLLEEYAAASRGGVSVRTVDPATLDEPDEVESLGVVPQQLQVSEEGEQRSAVVYSGLVIEYLDRRESIPFVFTSTTLEYDLTTTIQSLVGGETRTLAFLVGDPAQSLDATYRFAATELSRSYDVLEIGRGEPIPDAVDVALITDAQFLSPSQFIPVRDYLERGGAVLFCVERVDVDIAGGLSSSAIDEAPVFPFLESQGIVVGDELLLDESHNQIRVEEVAAEFRVTRAYPYPHWPATLEQFTSPEHPVTARFPGLDLYWPTWLETRGDAASVIVASSRYGWLMDEPYVLNPQRTAEFDRDAAMTTGQYGLVAITEAADGDGVRLAVVSDSDFVRDDLVGATGSSYNIEFTQNLAQWLSNDEELLAIRTRATRNLSLDAIDDPAIEAASVFVARAVNLAVVPAAVALYGVVRLARRRRRSQKAGRGS